MYHTLVRDIATHDSWVVYRFGFHFFHTDCGETLSWGAGSKGQLGQGHLRDRFTPLRVEALQQQNVVQISCNEYHSAAVTGKNKKWSPMHILCDVCDILLYDVFTSYLHHFKNMFELCMRSLISIDLH
jgi:hypothetical protein